MKAVTSIIISSLVLAACETTDVELPSIPTLEQETSSEELTPRTLSSVECGLFVWAGEARRFILFIQTGHDAHYANGEREVRLTPIAADLADVNGDLYGQIPVQSFQDETGRRYDLELSHASEIKDGIRYSEGRWRYKNDEGWGVITPVYGVSTCKADA